MYIAVDFDGTCVSNKFPQIGKDNGASVVLKELVKKGHKIILYSMRGYVNSDGADYLTNAVEWFKEHDIKLFAVNEHPKELGWWSDSPKIYADLYIDDLAFGVPMYNKEFVDWLVIYQTMYWDTTKDYVEHIDYQDYMTTCDKIKELQLEASKFQNVLKTEQYDRQSD